MLYKKSLELYSNLSTKKTIYSSPLCFGNSSHYSLLNKAFEKTLKSKKGMADLKTSSLEECKSQKLSSCVIIASYTKGFAGTNYSYVIYRGFQKLIKKSRRINNCTELKLCNSAYQIAPIGQVLQSDLTKLERQVLISCR